MTELQIVRLWQLSELKFGCPDRSALALFPERKLRPKIYSEDRPRQAKDHGSHVLSSKNQLQLFTLSV